MKPLFPKRTTKRTFLSWLGISDRTRILQIDDTPTGREEDESFLEPTGAKARGEGSYDESNARTRIDGLARWLVVAWALFLMTLTWAQGAEDGLFIFGLQVASKMNLAVPEFIAVVTTTTASVLAFLVIVTNYLFKR